MSMSRIISDWKEKSEIDYFPLFISLWLSFNAWMKDRTSEDNDRKRLKFMKSNSNRISDKFSELIRVQNANGNRFRSNIAELHQALENARIPYTQLDDGIISLKSCPITWAGKSSNLESIVKTKYQKSKVKIIDGFWVEDDIQRLFAAYIEIVYQIRCSLFHGDLAPNEANERVMKQLYLTLSMIMEGI